MKKPYLFMIIFLFVFGSTNAQFAIGNTDPDSSAIMDVSAADKGILIPRMTTLHRNSIGLPGVPAPGLLIYNTTDLGFNYYQSGWRDFSPAYYEVNHVPSIPITSYLDVVVPDMSFSPTKSGNYLAQFNAEYTLVPKDVTGIGVTDLNAAVVKLTNLGTGSSTLPAYTSTTALDVAFSNQTYSPGVYSIAGAPSLSGIITLDANNQVDKLFVFKISGAFNVGVGAAFEVKLINGALASNVFWISGGAVSLGANIIMKGNVIANNVAISASTGDLEGRLFSTAGALSFGPGTAKVPIGSSLIDFGILNSFVFFTSTGAIANAGLSDVTGDIGSNLGVISGFGNANVSGIICLPGNQIATANFSLYQNGVQIQSSLRTRTSNKNTIDISLQSVATTLLSGQPIDVRGKVKLGSLTLKNSRFSILKL